MQPIPHPEVEHLRRRCQELRQALQQTLHEWFHLRHELYPKLLADYERLFRDLELQLQHASLKAAQMRRRAELLVVKLQRGEVITEQTFALVERIVEREFAQLWERLQSATSPQPSPPPTEPEDFPKLYRILAKRLHPDAAGGETEEFRRYWHVLQRAYRERNLQQLQQLYSLLCGESEADSIPDDDLDALSRFVHQLEQRLAAEQRRLERLRNDEPFCLPLHDPTWVAQRRRELEEEIRQCQRQIDHYTDLINRIRSRTLTADDLQDPELLKHIAEQTYGRR
ncbi:MAG: hypothetical protein ABDH31_04575 [Chlorobiota bacterium]